MLKRASADTRRIYLTVDDGPDPEWTPRVLDLLAQARAQAAFFVIGRLARAAPALLRRLAQAGHAVGNHTWSHRHPWTMRAAAARLEVRDGTAALADILGRAPEYYRPPHGRLRRCMIEEARDCGQQVVLWNRSAIDWGPLATVRGVSFRLARARAGDIVLMHDGARDINRPDVLTTVLPAFFAALRTRDLQPAPLREAARGEVLRQLDQAGAT
jgi:peptidoglycan/xylan/chitin deacetylase (PgdA/CDA1 family)